MLTFGIIGTSWITHSFVECAHKTAEWDLRAVYSRKEESARDFAAKYPERASTIKTYTSLSDLFADPSLTAIYIASPNILHYEQAKQSLEAGKHVILEKPSCSTTSELTSLFALAKSKSLFLIEAWRHIQEPNFSILKSAIQTKLDGKITGASLHFEQFSSRYDKLLAGELPNIFDLAMGGGALVDLGVYTVAAAIWLFGAPTNSLYFPVKLSSGADGGGHFILTYDSFTVHLSSSKMYDSSAPSEIYGDNGTLSVPTITDIQSVSFWDPRKKAREVLGGSEGKGVEPKWNLVDEAREFARILNQSDWEAAGVLERHSVEVLKVTEKVRKDNGLVFPGGK
ncbi:unnamed protein product [Periconia digitata]|uniref:Gfo/Idh/MocA-like oxidoreductase N-terminal domain-containing protein n=1 Tax=Periconia digitata TaxID=1303443 RepID=A0A9W4UAZ2_9PLEO|nr:unnamed protein product [Periconia digitata]